MKTGPYVVVVGMDFSDLANRALYTALEFAWRRKDAVVHVVSILPGANMDTHFQIPGYAVNDKDGDLKGAVEHLRAHVQAQFEAFDGSLHDRPHGGSLKIVSHVRVDLPATGIVQLASDLTADLIVVGTHGRQGLERLIMGSVAESTVRNARCPVLVIPAPEGAVAAQVKIDPPCPRCVRVRAESLGAELWCEQHREHHGRRHTYHQTDRAGGETNLPLLVK